MILHVCCCYFNCSYLKLFFFFAKPIGIWLCCVDFLVKECVKDVHCASLLRKKTILAL